MSSFKSVIYEVRSPSSLKIEDILSMVESSGIVKPFFILQFLNKAENLGV